MDGPEARRWRDPSRFTSEDALAETLDPQRFRELFEALHPRLLRVLFRLSGESELAKDLVQEAFVALHRRGSLPDAPEAWLVTVALNKLRNERATHSRRMRLLEPLADSAPADPPPTLEQAAATAISRRRVRVALDGLCERDRQLLVLRSEGFRYRDMASVLDIHEASVGTLLARARRAFVAAYREAGDAPE
jgi:RNA polymerase sigma-70 factor (ECF subfamily)